MDHQEYFSILRFSVKFKLFRWKSTNSSEHQLFQSCSGSVRKRFGMFRRSQNVISDAFWHLWPEIWRSYCLPRLAGCSCCSCCFAIDEWWWIMMNYDEIQWKFTIFGQNSMKYREMKTYLYWCKESPRAAHTHTRTHRRANPQSNRGSKIKPNPPIQH